MTDDEDLTLDPMYRMPVVFGPAPGPRNLPRSKRALRYDGETLVLSVEALSEAAALQAILPPRFRLSGAPVFEVSLMQLTNVGWLAGRGYNILSVTIPAVFEGEEGPVEGGFMPVLWESLADPILTGREELGFPKLPAEIPAPRFVGGTWRCEALWQGFRFFEMELEGVGPPQDPAPASRPGLFWKYMPRTGQWGEADVEGPTTTGAGPAGAAGPRIETLERLEGRGSFMFRTARWEDMPTQYPIVNGLAALPVVAFRGASLVRRRGQGDLLSQAILR